MKLVGEKNASRFIESVVRDYVLESEVHEIKIPLYNGERKVFIRSPHLANPSDIDKLKMELVEETTNA